MTSRRAVQPRRSRKPTLRVERALHREGHRLIAGMDEVGRGALAGPVSVGVVIVDDTVKSAPVGLRDSKLLVAHKREELVAPVRRWALACGVGHAGPSEIDAIGIMAALRMAGRRALHAAGMRPDLVVLDGNHDWLTDPARDGLLAYADGATSVDAPRGSDPAAERDDGAAIWDGLPVRTVIKGDMSCSSVAAASILAKVERDAMMVGLAPQYPDYGWAVNKGYAAPEHRAALLRLGACELHRRSWNLLAAPAAAPQSAAAASGMDSSPETASIERGSQLAADLGWDMMCVEDETKVGG